MATKEQKAKAAPKKAPEPSEADAPLEQDPAPVIVVEDHVPEPQPAVQEAITEKWVAKIEVFLKEQVWYQLTHEQYDAVIKELKSRL